MRVFLALLVAASLGAPRLLRREPEPEPRRWFAWELATDTGLLRPAAGVISVGTQTVTFWTAWDGETR